MDLLHRAAACCREALHVCPSDHQRAGLLPTAVVVLYAAGLHAEATELANEMTAVHAGFNHEALCHWGHGTLGLIALERGDVEAACSYLSASVPPTAGFFMESFGPYLDLAAALYQRDRIDAVRHFLVELGKAWPQGKDEVDRWVEEIDAGSTPDFVGAGGGVTVPWNDR